MVNNPSHCGILAGGGHRQADNPATFADAGGRGAAVRQPTVR
jgi:hypothetical protein